MKKSLILAGMLAIGYANAQYDGKVGINTEEPKATLEVTPSSKNLSGTTNEGLLIPRLSKERVAKMASPEISTLVYINDVSYVGAETTIANIDAVGFYHYNGTQWVKHLDTDTNTSNWAQGINPDGSKYYYFVPFSNEGQEHSINKQVVGRDGVLEYKAYTSDLLSKTNKNAYWGFNDASYTIKKDHIDNANNNNNEVRYQAQFRGIYTDNDATRNVKTLLGGTNVATLGNPQGISSVTLGSPLTSLSATEVTGFITRGDSYTSGTVGTLTGLQATASNIGGGTVTNLQGGSFLGRNRTNGTAVNVRGIYSQTVLEANSTTDLAYGGLFTLGATNATVNSAIQGLRSDVTLSGTTISTGISQGLRNILTLRNTSSIKQYEAVNATFFGDAGTSVSDYIGYALTIASTNQSTVSNMYGIKLPDITKGNTLNYAIHTGAGAVRFGDLRGSGNRPVYADADGKLIIGDATNTATSFKWVEDTSNSSVKLAVTSTGALRTTNPVYITDEGQVYATSFKGSNGATIFPDYVFQKYYTGNSSIKADYTFKTLSQVEDFVKTNGHLPGYKSAEVIKAQGYVDLMETQLTNVEKIEELYLHSIEQEKAIKAKDAKIQELEARLEKLEKLLK